jgi:hypothetical protein
MLEVIKLLLDIFNKLFDPAEISKLSKEKKIKDLGAELYLLYIRLNELLVNGYFIVEELRRYAYRRDPYTDGSGYWLQCSVRAQLRYIENVIQRLNKLRFQLQILDIEAYFKLEILLSSKQATLQTLKNMLWAGVFPIMKYDDLQSAVPSKPPEEYINSEIWEREELLNPIREIINMRLHENSLSITKAWDKNTYERLKAYLSSREPEARLDEIGHSLQKLHEALLKNFDIQDILLAVGDKRFQESDIRINK